MFAGGRLSYSIEYSNGLMTNYMIPTPIYFSPLGALVVTAGAAIQDQNDSIHNKAVAAIIGGFIPEIIEACVRFAIITEESSVYTKILVECFAATTMATIPAFGNILMPSLKIDLFETMIDGLLFLGIYFYWGQLRLLAGLVHSDIHRLQALLVLQLELLIAACKVRIEFDQLIQPTCKIFSILFCPDMIGILAYEMALQQENSVKLLDCSIGSFSPFFKQNVALAFSPFKTALGVATLTAAGLWRQKSPDVFNEIITVLIGGAILGLVSGILNRFFSTSNSTLVKGSLDLAFSASCILAPFIGVLLHSSSASPATMLFDQFVGAGIFLVLKNILNLHVEISSLNKVETRAKLSHGYQGYERITATGLHLCSLTCYFNKEVFKKKHAPSQQEENNTETETRNPIYDPLNA